MNIEQDIITKNKKYTLSKFLSEIEFLVYLKLKILKLTKYKFKIKLFDQYLRKK